jgi:hypothetical protein
MTLQLIDETALQIRRRLRCLHDTTSRPLTSINSRLIEPTRLGWTLRVVREDVVVSSWDRLHGAGATVRVAVSITDPALRARLAAPDAELTLVGLDDEHRFVPAPTVVTMSLVDGEGAPRAGRTVRLRGDDASLITLTEASPAVYASDPTTLTSAFARPELRIGDTNTGVRIALDPTRRKLSVRLIDPTA